MTRVEVETNAANKRFKQLFYEHSRRLQGNAILENLKMNGFRRSMKIVRDDRSGQLLQAYRLGVFPMAMERTAEIGWFRLTAHNFAARSLSYVAWIASGRENSNLSANQQLLRRSDS